MNEGQKRNRLKMHSPDPTEAIAVRLESAVKARLKAMAERERRGIANMIEVTIRGYCGRNGIAIPEQGDLLEGNKNG